MVSCRRGSRRRWALHRLTVRMPETVSNAGKPLLLPATPRPGDFPLGSMESRAAARMEVGRIERKPKPMVRIFEDGALTTEYEYDGEKGITVHIEHIGEEP